MTDLKAIEFFSGIGAFAQAARAFPIEIVAAYDQSREANLVYELNHGLKPHPRNLDSIAADDIPEADLWWMSPPCTPFSRRGRQRDQEDPRAASFLNLIALLGEKRPRYVMVENVSGFVGSEVHSRLISALSQSTYQVAEIDLCSTMFGTPMKRPRRFVVASRAHPPYLQAPSATAMKPLRDFLDHAADNRSDDKEDRSLPVDDRLLARYRPGLNIVDLNDDAACLICFTSNYWKSLRAAGSLIATGDGQARRLTATEMLRLFGFADTFTMPPAMTNRTKWRLIGNSVDVRCVRHLLGTIMDRKHAFPG